MGRWVGKEDVEIPHGKVFNCCVSGRPAFQGTGINDRKKKGELKAISLINTSTNLSFPWRVTDRA